MQPPNRPGIPDSGGDGFHGDHRTERSSDEERLRQAGREGVEAARQQAESKLSEGKQSTAEAATSASRALDDTAASFSAQGQESLAQAARALSQRLSGLSGYLEHRSIDDLTREARELARRNPALFIAGGVALGLTLSRFFKASSYRPQEQDVAGAEDELDPRYPSTPGAGLHSTDTSPVDPASTSRPNPSGGRHE
jgi:hypothetical protein